MSDDPLGDTIESFNSLSDQDKLAFIQQLMKDMPPTATHLLMLFKAAPDADKYAFTERILNEHLIPLLSEERIHATMDRVVIPQVQALLKKQKEARDRSSDPQTIKRNVEICDLRKADKKKWSQGKLAKHFKVTDRYIRKVLADENKWRDLLTKQEQTNQSYQD